jgi:hypothetical protein
MISRPAKPLFWRSNFGALSMIDRSESDLIAQEQRNRSGTPGALPGAAAHGSDRVARRKRAAAGAQSVRIEPVVGHGSSATPSSHPKQ